MSTWERGEEKEETVTDWKYNHEKRIPSGSTGILPESSIHIEKACIH